MISKEAMEKHKKWAMSDGEEGERFCMPGADLSKTYLCEAVAKKDITRETDFRSADLQKVDFSYSDMRNADFRDSDATGCNMANTDLRKADFRDAILSGTNLSNADMREADTFNADMRKVKR